MVLVDTSVWIDFLRNDNKLLKEFLEKGEVVTHPFIIGELTCGNISKRKHFFQFIEDLPSCVESNHEEVISLIESRKLYGLGVGYVDMHILSSAILSNFPLWTLDKRLSKISKRIHSVI